MAADQRGESNEFAVIDAIAKRFGAVPEGQVWIGDDAAVVGSHHGLLLTADMVVAGVHADLSLVSLADFGWKALAVNVSDIAAMGGRPLHALVSVAGPAEVDLDQLYDGLVEASSYYSCPVVGGDLSDAPVLVVSVALTGTSGDMPAVLRSGARAGDTVFVTGPLGASAAGLERLRHSRGRKFDHPQQWSDLVRAHRRPQARVAEGQAAASGGARAMIDISDGLGADLDHLARASGVGVALDDVPVAAGASREQALGGGEDYELVFAAPDPEEVARTFERAGLRTPIVLGSCTEDRDERRLGRATLAASGWKHWQT